MEKEGCKVVEAANGEQGLDVYKRLKPHLVILDALMPVMDGFTCCKHLHKLSDKTSPDSEHLEAQGLQGVSKTPVLMKPLKGGKMLLRCRSIADSLYICQSPKQIIAKNHYDDYGQPNTPISLALG